MMVPCWVAFAPKAGLAGRDAVRWLIWPVGYATDAMVRGLPSGFESYPFMTVSMPGLSQVMLIIAVPGLRGARPS